MWSAIPENVLLSIRPFFLREMSDRNGSAQKRAVGQTTAHHIAGGICRSGCVVYIADVWIQVVTDLPISLVIAPLGSTCFGNGPLAY
jgi:hypothetical protein